MKTRIGLTMAVLLAGCSGNGGTKSDSKDTGADADSDSDTDTDTIDWGETVPCPVAPGFKEVCVPGGKYLMGCVPGDTECEENETPLVEVTLSPFFLDAEEANCVDTIAFLNTLREGFIRKDDFVSTGTEWIWMAYETAIRLDENEDYSWVDVPVPGTDDDPQELCPYRKVGDVCGGFSWLGARLFCEWKGKQLPTEAQWEAGARGQSLNKYPCPETPLCWYDWIDCCSQGNSACYFDTCGECRTPFGAETLVCDKPFGAVGLAGNAGEWVADGLDADHSWCAQGCTDPAPRPGVKKVVKGGNLCWSMSNARISARQTSWDDYGNTGRPFLGTRCVRPAEMDTDTGTDTDGVLPSNACSTGGQDRQGCPNARIIGRADAAGWYSLESQNTCWSGDHHQGDCGGQPSSGNDHTYAIYARAGEVLAVVVERKTGWSCDIDESYVPNVRLLVNEDAGPEGVTDCPITIGCWAAETDLKLTRVHSVAADGWYFIVLDGGPSELQQDRGYYHLKVRLSNCAQVGCGC